METVFVLERLHEHVWASLRSVVGDLDDHHMGACAAAIDARPIWEIAVHVHRPVLAVACALAGIERPPRPAPPTSTRELFDILEGMVSQIETCLGGVPRARWAETLSLPWGPQPALDAYLDCIVHGLIHVGQIAGVRAINGFPTAPESA